MTALVGTYAAKLPLGLCLSGGWILLVMLVALLAGVISPHDPLEQDLLYGNLPPLWMEGSEVGFFLGTDSLGRDVLTRLLHGAQIALLVALPAALVACLLGSTLGIMAGYFGGWVDIIVSRMVDIWMSFPPVLFSVLLVAVMGPGLYTIIFAIAIIDWTRFCRVLRSEAILQSRLPYIDSARIQGFTPWTILWREVLPNCLPTLLALLSLEMGIAIIVEAILSFVNLSIATDDPTWGGMISEGRAAIHHAWWVMVFPLLALFLTVLAFSQLGEGLKQRFDPVLQ